MTPEQREWLIEVMARGMCPHAWGSHEFCEWGIDQRNFSREDARNAIAAAERAGFKWEGPKP